MNSVPYQNIKLSNSDVLRISLEAKPRRGMRLPDAAYYVNVSESKFLQMVADGLMPKSFKSKGVTLWDLHKIDAAFDELSNQDDAESVWDGVYA